MLGGEVLATLRTCRARLRALTEAVTATLGQQSHDRAVTAGYVGSRRISKTIRSSSLDRPMAKKRKFTKEEITAMRVAKGLDASEPRARQRVAYAEKKGRVKACRR
jgi:response regulator of citrate/malate metabolism